ncbi:hypothetical protein QTP70_029329 [Hemibagrus guttatus]|uniref:Legumain n=1 Tax=Hemibagrus guttatus TaxID=175788 RepID=A0AAE0V1G2_9TELE|nr:hypothetical protein QTP70_029329 [Hemibagrus guttatus]
MLQANVCHAYQFMHQNGIPDEQIVVMMYDDIAHNKENPDPGEIINVPNGPNVYTGVPKDYTGEEVSAENFLAVLRGDSSAVKKTGPKKVIQSGKNDTVFIYIYDHGGHGIFCFPNSTLYAYDLINTVRTMSTDGKFSKVKLNTTSFGDQFSYLRKKVSDAVKPPKSQTPCNYSDMKRKTMDEALQKIAERIKASQALSEKREVTRTYELKVVAEHFRENLFNWEKEPHVVTHSHLQVLVNLCELGLKVERINEAITHVSKDLTF